MYLSILGCEKEKMVGVIKQRTRCMLGVTAVRARARAREQRRPLVGYTTAQANRLLAGSCSAPRTLRGAGQSGIDMLTALTWPEKSVTFANTA